MNFKPTLSYREGYGFSLPCERAVYQFLKVILTTVFSNRDPTNITEIGPISQGRLSRPQAAIIHTISFPWCMPEMPHLQSAFSSP